MIRLEDLPERYQKQAMDQLAGRQTKRKATEKATDHQTKQKYRNQPETVGGIRFDSKKEARRYLELYALEAAGEISELKLQPEFTLQEAYTTSEGTRVRAIRYRADFSYIDKEGAQIVEDVKSRATKTRVYAIKKKLVRERFGIEIQEI